MLRYIGKRILIAIPTFLGITILVYVLSSMAPGTPLEMIFNDPNATAEQMAAMKAKLGLDQPVMIQYFTGWYSSCMEIWVHLTEQDTLFGQTFPNVSDRHCSLPCLLWCSPS